VAAVDKGGFAALDPMHSDRKQQLSILVRFSSLANKITALHIDICAIINYIAYKRIFKIHYILISIV